MPKPYTPNDKWSQKAQKEGYRARSVYKLMEIDERFRLLKKGMNVLDLGAAPGSWLQYEKEQVGEKGIVVGVDLQEIDPLEGVLTLKGDITDIDWLTKTLPQANSQMPIAFDLIVSDLAPKTSGVKDVDQWRSIELSQAVLDTAKEFLKPKGTCVMKILRGADFDEFFQQCKKEWKYAKTFIATASRDRSREVYVVVQEQC